MTNQIGISDSEYKSPEAKAGRRGCARCGHVAAEHTVWWCVDEGSGMACSRPECNCDDIE